MSQKMTRFSLQDVKTKYIEVEDEIVENEIVEPPADTLYYEQTGPERYPTFTVHLVMNHEDISQRDFQTEEEADLCLHTLYPILGKEPCVAIQEFQSYGK